MSKLVNIAKASEATGLSPYELRTGAKAGRYPHLRAGGEKRGTILFDLELLQDAITRQMLSRVTLSEDCLSGRIRAVL